MFAWLADQNVTAFVGWAGLLVSFAGFVLTIAVYRSTSAIRQTFLISARVPKQLEDLRVCGSAISEHLAGAELSNAALRRDVVRLGEIAISISEKIASEDASIASRLRELCDSAKAYEVDRTLDRLTDIYVKAQASCEALAQWLQDRDWRTHNGS